MSEIEKKLTGFALVKPDSADNENIAGFVALIDVLGFRELVSRDNELLQVREYVDVVSSILDDRLYKQLQFVVFSDNLVINTRDEERGSFSALIQACSDIFYHLARRQIAVRGAAAHGSFMRSPNKRQGVIVAGRPIVEADYYQHSQNWVGVMLAPSVVRRDNEALRNEVGTIPCREANESESQWLERISLALSLRKWENIPFRAQGDSGNGSYDGFAVLPMRPKISSITDAINSLEKTLRDLGMMKATAPNAASQQKYSETELFIQKAITEWARFNALQSKSGAA